MSAYQQIRLAQIIAGKPVLSESTLTEDFKLGKPDKSVIVAFTDKKAGESKRLTTDGKTLDINGMGGRGVAEWKGGKIHLVDLGGRSSDVVHRAIRKEAPKNDIAESIEEGVPEKHQLKIALKTLKYAKEIVGVMGPPSHAEAVQILRKNGYSDSKILALLKKAKQSASDIKKWMAESIEEARYKRSEFAQERGHWGNETSVKAVEGLIKKQGWLVLRSEEKLVTGTFAGPRAKGGESEYYIQFALSGTRHPDDLKPSDRRKTIEKFVKKNKIPTSAYGSDGRGYGFITLERAQWTESVEEEGNPWMHKYVDGKPRLVRRSPDGKKWVGKAPVALPPPPMKAKKESDEDEPMKEDPRFLTRGQSNYALIGHILSEAKETLFEQPDPDKGHRWIVQKPGDFPTRQHPENKELPDGWRWWGESVDEAKSERQVAQGMKKKGYTHILLRADGGPALYAKSLKMAKSVQADHKDKNFTVRPIDDYLSESVLEGQQMQIRRIDQPNIVKMWPTTDRTGGVGPGNIHHGGPVPKGWEWDLGKKGESIEEARGKFKVGQRVFSTAAGIMPSDTGIVLDGAGSGKVMVWWADSGKAGSWPESSLKGAKMASKSEFTKARNSAARKYAVELGGTMGQAFQGVEWEGTYGQPASESIEEAASRPLYQIAAEIEKAWKKVNYAARPYLDAMHELDSIKDKYYADPGSHIVAYFLSNASSFRGPEAKAIKIELKKMLKESEESSDNLQEQVANFRQVVGSRPFEEQKAAFRASIEELESYPKGFKKGEPWAFKVGDRVGWKKTQSLFQSGTGKVIKVTTPPRSTEEVPPQILLVKWDTGPDQGETQKILSRNLTLTPLGRPRLESMNESQQIAKTILQQMGGQKRLAIMTGAKNFIWDEKTKTLQFKIGRNAKGVNKVRITLRNDLYDVEFGAVRGASYKVKAKERGIYADMLGPMFEKHTGMYLKLVPGDEQLFGRESIEEGKRMTRWSERSMDKGTSITAPPDMSGQPAKDMAAMGATIKKGIKLPFVNASIMTLGGPNRPTLFITLGWEPKSSWENNIFENSVYAKISLDSNGVMEMFTRPWKRGMKLPFLRKGKYKNAADALRKINAVVKKVQTALQSQAESIEESGDKPLLKKGDKFQPQIGAQSRAWQIPDGLDDGVKYEVTKVQKRQGEWVYELKNLKTGERFAHYADDVDRFVDESMDEQSWDWGGGNFEPGKPAPPPEPPGGWPWDFEPLTPHTPPWGNWDQKPWKPWKPGDGPTQPPDEPKLPKMDWRPFF